MTNRVNSSLPPVLPSLTLMVADRPVQRELADLFRESQANIRSQLAHSKKFERDWRVVGLNNLHIIPHAFLKATDDETYLLNKFIAILPRSSQHLIENDNPLVGFGCDQKNIDSALSEVHKHMIPYHNGLSSIEGGNVQTFFHLGQRKPKAIVGTHSVTLTMIGLEQHGYFDSEENKEEYNHLMATLKPSEEDIRRARNMMTFAFYSAGLIMGPEYRKMLARPLSEYDLENYYDREASEWAAKEAMAKKVIASDLRVNLPDIAFIPQTMFHIDMFTSIAPDGVTVYVNRDSPQPGIVCAIKKELKKIGCRVVLVSGIHMEDGMNINFMNGIFVPIPSGHLYITNGDSSNEKTEELRQSFEKQIGYKVVLVRAAQCVLDQSHGEGGIRCLTWERFEYRTPLEIIAGYLADLPMPIPPERVCELWKKC